MANVVGRERELSAAEGFLDSVDERQCEHDRIAFTHPLFAEAILFSATAAERRPIHRRLASAVEGSEACARHLALAHAGQDEPTATVVQAAVGDALLRGAPAAAAELAELALRLSQPDSELEQLRTIELAECLCPASENRRARELLEAVRSWEGWAPSLQTRGVACLCSLVIYTESEVLTAIEFQERMLREPLCAEARAAVHSELSYSTSELDAAKAALHADAALDLIELIGDEADPAIHARALYMRLRTSVLLGEGLDREVVGRICAVEARLPPARRTTDPVSPSIANWLRHVDDLNAARTWLERMLQEAIESGNETGELHALSHLAITECWAGNLEVAHRYALSAVRLAGELNATHAALLAREALALADAHLGNVEEVHAIAEGQPPPTPLTRHGTLVFRAA